MAFGCVPVTTGQWLPNSEAGSSTLSPLAQPFVVVRNNPKLIPDTSGHPYRDRPDHFVQPTLSSAPVDVYHPPASMATELGRHQGGGFPSGGSDWPVRRTLSSNLVQAEPFYPQYELRDSGASKPPPAGFGFNERSDYDCLDRNHTHWKIPFSGDCDWESGTGRRIPSWIEPKGLGTEGIRKHSDSRDNNALENSSWAEFPGKGRVSNYGPAIQRGDNADASLPYDNIWQRNHVESYVMKGQDTGCIDWLDGSSIHLQTSRAASTNMLNTSVLSEDLSATAPVRQVNIADVSKESCGTLCASPSSYYTLATEPGFHKSEQNDHYVDTAYSYSNISSPPLMKMNPLPSSTLQSRKFSAEPLKPHHSNNLYRRRVSVTIREPNLNSSVIGEKPGAGKSDKSHDMSASYRLPNKSPRNENASGSESKVDDLKNFSHMKTEVGKTSPSVNGSTDINDSTHNSTTVDQSNNAVDSPCWKGASAFRYSPLFDSDSAACSNAAQKSEKLELSNLTATDSIQVSEGFEKQDGNLILKEFKDDGPSKESCLLLSGTSANNCPFTAQSSCGNGILNDCAATRPFLLDDESNMYQCVKGDVPNSSAFGVLDLENNAERRASEIKLSSMRYCDTHFLVRSIYDLSALLSSCYNGESMLKKIDYDVLLMAKYNLEACLAKKSEPQKESFICQQKANFVGDTYGPIEECRKTLKQKIHAHDENCESNAYKRLWIEAEAALCSMKYQLQVVRTSAGLINDTKLMEHDLQDSSDSGESPVQMMKTSLSTESPVKMKSSLSTTACDFIGASHTPTVTHEGLGNHYVGFWGNPDGCNVKPHVQSDTSKDFEASVMARFNVLRSRDSKISTMGSQKQKNPQSLVASETNLSTNQMDSIFSDSQFTAGVRSFIVPSESTSAKSSQPLGFTSRVRSPQGKRGLLSSVNANHGDQVGEVHRTIFEAQVFPQGTIFEAQVFPQEARLARGTENIIESYIPDNGPWRAQLTGKHSTAGSSDWEHVLKDDVTR